MAFQFLCPQGHLLQGEESQAGQQCSCPQCGTLFLIPQPVAAPAAGPGVESSPPGQNPPAGPAPDPGEEGFPGIRTDGPPSRPGGSTATATPSAPADERPEFVHIACPSGHELETPREWLGQLAMCPFCKAQFHLRWKKSVEYRQRKQEELERKQARTAKLWLQWSIGAAVLVVLGLIVAFVLF